jgi:hypothetical protein
MTKTITKDDAVKTAKQAAAKSAFLQVSTTTTAQPTTTTTVKSGKKQTTTTTTAKKTTTTVNNGVQSATLIHTDDPGITGGKDLLVWQIKLTADQTAGRTGAVVYVDAVNDKALLVLAA